MSAVHNFGVSKNIVDWTDQCWGAPIFLRHALCSIVSCNTNVKCLTDVKYLIQVHDISYTFSLMVIVAQRGANKHEELTRLALSRQSDCSEMRNGVEPHQTNLTAKLPVIAKA